MIIFLTMNHNFIKLEVPIIYKFSRFEVFTVSLGHEITTDVPGKEREEQMKKEYFLFFLWKSFVYMEKMFLKSILLHSLSILTCFYYKKSSQHYRRK